MSLLDWSHKSYNKVCSMMEYRKYVIKKHIDIPECEQKGRCIILTAETKNNKEYKNYPYFMATNPYNFTADGTDPFGYCIGYNVTTIPYGNGCTEKFMPIYLHKYGEKRINMNLEFKEAYGKYLKKNELKKKMWTILITLLCVKIPAKIGYCGELVQTDSCIPIEIAHIIYEFGID